MKEFLTSKEIAKLEQVTQKTVGLWVRKGLFPGARKVGKAYRVPLSDYHRWRESTKLNQLIMHERTNGQTNTKKPL